MYTYSSGAWSQLGLQINGRASVDRFGKDLKLSADGRTVVIGANTGESDDRGHVRVFTYTSGAWAQHGSDILGEAAGDMAGNAVDISADGTAVVIGSIQNDGGGIGAGAGQIRVFTLPALGFAAPTPAFGSHTATADGFTVQISNYDAAYTWAGTATVSGTVRDPLTAHYTITH